MQVWLLSFSGIFSPPKSSVLFFSMKNTLPITFHLSKRKKSTKKRLFSREILPGSVKLKKNLASVTALLRRATGSGSPNSSPRGASPNNSPRSGNDFWGWLRGFLGTKFLVTTVWGILNFYPFEEKISEMVSTTISEKWSKTLMYLIRISCCNYNWPSFQRSKDCCIKIYWNVYGARFFTTFSYSVVV